MYRNGDISYADFGDNDIGGWKSAGATRGDILESVGEFGLIDGARDTVRELKQRGYKLGVVSGTLDIVLDSLFPDHPFDDVYTNRIFFDEDGKIASWQPTPFDAFGKPDAVKEIARKHEIPLAHSAFVGDGENDVPLLGVSGYFVAYNPRSAALEAGADLVIRNGDLPSLLDVFV